LFRFVFRDNVAPTKIVYREKMCDYRDNRYLKTKFER
jgi:hypothetical protein